MDKLTPEGLVKIVRDNPDLNAAFSGARSLQFNENRAHIVPSSYTITYGTPTGSLSSITSYRDGNAMLIDEVVTNGIQAYFYFDNVDKFQTLFLSAKYVGSTSHWIAVSLLDATNSTYYTVGTLNSSPTSGSDATDIEGHSYFIAPNSHYRFISTSRRTTLKLLHGGTGPSASHDLWIDYMALIV